MQESDGDVDVDRIALNGNQSFMHIDRSARHGRRPRIRDTNDALRLCTNLVDLDTAFANDCQSSRQGQFPRATRTRLDVTY